MGTNETGRHARRTNNSRHRTGASVETSPPRDACGTAGRRVPACCERAALARGNGAASAFTLTELLVVIAIIAVLAGLIMPSFMDAQRDAKKIDCANNLKNFFVAIEIYKGEDMHNWPLWLSQMEDSLPSQEIFICPLDETGGVQGGKPDALAKNQYAETNDMTSFTETDNDALNDSGITRWTDGDENRNPNITACSYLYEWTAEKCSWYNDGDYPISPDLDLDNDGTKDAYSWRNAKRYEASLDCQMSTNWVGGATGYTGAPHVKVRGRVPVVRCFWHQKIEGGEMNEKEWDVLNVRIDGAVNTSAPHGWWTER